jgi:exopolyphosphatase/guanosine-5'-triphosphate,3'-diphosphate pyrophosphatase
MSEEAAAAMGTASEQGRFAELEPLGVIDIGSNSVRLVVYEGAVRCPTPLFNEKVLCGLGRAVAATGQLGGEAVERTIFALRRFAAIARILRVKNLRAIATAAVRDARDGGEFLARAEEACGVRIVVLSGEREAELAALGIEAGFHAPNGIVGDLGGGSLELVDVADGQALDAVTLPLGGLRLLQSSGGRIEQAQQIVDEQLSRVPWLDRGAARSFFAVGGAWRALARLHMERTRYPLRVMHGYALGARQTLEFCEAVSKQKRLADLAEAAGISRPRREVLPVGAVVLDRLVRRLAPRDVVFSVFGIREGLLFSLLAEHERRKDPLLTFCHDYARLRSRSLRHAEELCSWTDRIFAAPGAAETPDERRLRHAACLLSDIGWRAHPDYRGEQSLNVIAHSALAGIDHPGRVFLALTVYHRHVGHGDDDGRKDDLSERLKSLVPKRIQRRARTLGAAIRTAHMLSIGMAGIIDETPIVLEGGRLVLELPERHASLDGERLRRRLDNLAQTLDVVAEVRRVP